MSKPEKGMDFFKSKDESTQNSHQTNHLFSPAWRSSPTRPLSKPNTISQSVTADPPRKSRRNRQSLVKTISALINQIRPLREMRIGLKRPVSANLKCRKMVAASNWKNQPLFKSKTVRSQRMSHRKVKIQWKQLQPGKRSQKANSRRKRSNRYRK